MLFLTSPNNPDGGIISDADIDRLLQLPVLVVLDEAYIEFSSSAVSRISDVPSQDNLVVLRTFSKRAALAGCDSRYPQAAHDCVSPVHTTSKFITIFSRVFFRLENWIRSFSYQPHTVYMARKTAL